MPDEPKRNVLPFRSRSAGDVQTIVREIAGADRYVYLSAHARLRMEERGISRLDVVRVLQRGHVCGEIKPGQKAGELKCKIVARLKGSREIGVITIVVEEKKLFVKTVEWEDLS